MGYEPSLAQRIFGLALGYEDLNDHEQLRSDPLLALLSGKRDLDEPLAGESTLSRLELVGRTGRYHKIGYSAPALDRLLGDLFLESHSSRPEQIVLDLDATDIPLTAISRSASSTATTTTATAICRCTSSVATSYCARVCVRPTRTNKDAAAGAGAVEEVSRIVAQVRQRWPKTRIVLRADSGFCREELMALVRGQQGGLPVRPWRATSGSAGS